VIKSGRIFFGVAVFLLLIAAIPLSKALQLRSSVYSTLKGPIVFSRSVAQLFLDLAHFQSNAAEVQRLKAVLAGQKLEDYQAKEILLENG
ncbi:hypothetical protein, partial [Francisella tularensis]|uniref:hypothetical protein n=1 Tax=Francisella tularensis TaxID=263 RepID=UPI0023819C74